MEKKRIYYYVTSNGCINMRLYLSMEEAIKEGAYFIDVFDEDGMRIIRYRKEADKDKGYKYEVVEAI